MTTLAVVLSALAALGAAAGEVVVCQHSSWSAYRTPPGNFSPSLLDPNLCTHGVYAFVALYPNTDQFVAGDSYVDLDSGLGGYSKFIALKQINPNFKALLALGGWSSSSSQFMQIAANPVRRSVLIQSAVEYLKRYGFDGLEFDWLYPFDSSIGANFAILLAEMRQAFDAEGLILTASVGPNIEHVRAYDLVSMSKSCDFLIMMTYEYNGPWWLTAAIHAPMHFVNLTTQEYLTYGALPSKLVLSIPAYGHSYTLQNPANHNVGSKARAAGVAGPYTRNPGTLSYGEIYADLPNWTVERDEASQAPYAYKGDQWVSYDDETYAAVKIQYLKSLGLAGAAIWTVADDYFQARTFPLLRTVHTALQQQCT